MVLRNATYNILGLGLPLVVAVVTIPALIAALGPASFGVLTIIWAVVSYFGLFDLGLGRAVTQQLANAMAAGKQDSISAILGTSFFLMAVLGVIGGVVMAALAPLLADQLATATTQQEVVTAFFWMALAMPAIVMTSGYRGVLEALGRFGLINAIRLPMGIFTFLGPLAVVWSGYPRLDMISAVLCVGRIIACVVHAWFALRAVPGQRGHGRPDRAMIRPLVTMGGWLSVSNIVSPLMNYIDRLMLGLLVSAAAVAYYATPQELILRIGIVPGAVAAVLFPLFAAGSSDNDVARDQAHVRRYSLLIGGLMLPPTLVLLLFADPILSAWITPEFAREAAPILQIMAVAALASGLAQVPYTMLQGKGRADITAKLHLIELPLYLALLYFLVLDYGANGAAWAWLARISADYIALYWLNVKFCLPYKRLGNFQ